MCAEDDIGTWVAWPSKAARAVIGFWLVTVSSGGPPPEIQPLRPAGELRVATIQSPTSYFHGPEGPGGFEYDLVRGYAERLGVEPNFVFARTADEIAGMLARREVDLAAANVAVTGPLAGAFEFGPTYMMVSQQVIHLRGTLRPRTLADLVGHRVLAKSGSRAAELLADARDTSPDLVWAESPWAERDLLARLVAGDTDYAVMSSHLFTALQRYYPETTAAFALGEPEAVAWMYSTDDDDNLDTSIRDYFRSMRGQGAFAAIWNRHFGRTDAFDHDDVQAFVRAYRTRLRDYRGIFERTGGRFGIDWHLIAALSYQESRWRASARSPTGVRGLMMLTRPTARELNVDRLDPDESVMGGVRYLTKIRARLPQRIAEPDRTWLALAAYNLGPGHLEDARVLTQRHGMNPDRWEDVKNHLPLLAQRQWFETTRHGYARGPESVKFVHGVRRYLAALEQLEPLAARASAPPRS